MVWIEAKRYRDRLAQRRRHRHRGQLDFRQTVRDSLSYGGVPAEPKFKRPPPSKPEIMVIADISGSVAIPNAGGGIEISNGASSNRVGTDSDGQADALERNVVSGNNRAFSASVGCTFDSLGNNAVRNNTNPDQGIINSATLR